MVSVSVSVRVRLGLGLGRGTSGMIRAMSAYCKSPSGWEG